MLSRSVLLLVIAFCIGGHCQDATLLQRGTSSRCPLGFTGYKSSCYLFSHDRATYAEALSLCWSFESRLAEISSRDEENFIIGNLKRKGGGASYYIGGSDMRVEGIWTWEKPLRRISYQNWYPGQPRNYKGHEHCLELASNWGYRMNDVPCESRLRFVCEKNL